jgi:hypothetical protein
VHKIIVDYFSSSLGNKYFEKAFAFDNFARFVSSFFLSQKGEF